MKHFSDDDHSQCRVCCLALIVKGFCDSFPADGDPKEKKVWCCLADFLECLCKKS